MSRSQFWSLWHKKDRESWFMLHEQECKAAKIFSFLWPFMMKGTFSQNFLKQSFSRSLGWHTPTPHIQKYHTFLTFCCQKVAIGASLWHLQRGHCSQQGQGVSCRAPHAPGPGSESPDTTLTQLSPLTAQGKLNMWYSGDIRIPCKCEWAWQCSSN